jgi:hypothetical protein
MPGRGRLHETDADILRWIRSLAVKPPQGREPLSAPRVREKLLEKFPGREREIGSESRIRRLIRDLKELEENPDQRILESPFEWHRIGEYFKEYGIPWEASPFALQEVRYYFLLSAVNDLAACERKYRFNSWHAPTVREMKWRWKIRQAAPEIEAEVGCRADVRHLASKFVDREVLGDLCGRPAEFDDLEAALAMKPWLDEDHHQGYHLAVELGVIPPSRREKHTDEMAATVIEALASVPEGKIRFLLGAGAVVRSAFTSKASRSKNEAMERPQVGQESGEVTLEMSEMLGITPSLATRVIQAARAHGLRGISFNDDHPELLFSQQLEGALAGLFERPGADVTPPS